VLYQVYPRSFQDSDDDGIGDLTGITQRLGYLRDLGFDAVWISPFYPSPMADFGYDISDHTGVDPIFGDLADFDRLVGRAHELGIRVLVDFVPNHTSDRHPWFLDARSARASAHRDWYIWADPAADGGPPNNWRSVFGGPAWTFDDATGQYYYHAYLVRQPDLNWRNPDVRAAMHDVLRTWLDRGVDGFRIDAARQLIKDDRLRDNPVNPDYRAGLPPYEELVPRYTTDRPEVLDVLAGLRSVVRRQRPDALLMAEMYLPIERLVHYYGAHDDGVHLPSNMHLISEPWTAEAIGALVHRYEAALPPDAWPNWVLSNHDRSRVASRLGSAQARVAAMLLLTLRGTPLVYYGDEIGMLDVPVPPELVQDPVEKQLPGIGVGRDPERSPMRWTGDVHGGFCAPDVTPWLPMADEDRKVNVADSASDPGSMLSLYRSLIALRQSSPELALAPYEPLVAADGVLAYRRGPFTVALNFTGSPRTVPQVDGGVVRVGTSADRVGAAMEPPLTLRADEGVVLA
jgi:alpha-glucosidase